MFDIRTVGRPGDPDVLALAVAAAGDDGEPALLAAPADLADEVAAFVADAEHRGAAGSVHTLPRPLRTPRRLLLVGVGAGDEAGWRAAGAALARAARRDESLTVALPGTVEPAAVRGLAEGAWLAGYRFRLGAEPEDAPRLAELRLAGVDGEPAIDEALATARAVATATRLARDWTNTPADRKSPAWLAEEMVAAATGAGVRATVRGPDRLAAEGFRGILAVGGGSARPPRLVELVWEPPGASTHVVLVGKGITFDTGGICIKPTEGMKLMRKDMGGAAAVAAAVVGAAALGLRVRVTVLAPLAENMLSGAAFRPGDVVAQYGGVTTEVLNTDAEGRVVLADALAYAVAELRPDHVVELATLTGAQGVALGKRTAALYSDSDALAGGLAAAAAAAGEKVWRMPLPVDYVEHLRSDVADLVNSTEVGAGSVMAALFMREFAGDARDRFAHVDMSSSAWADGADGELTKGATGWGVRTLLRWLATLA